ncbi:MAG: tRNA (guanosine(37)-N1)-methyltransferase TrmD [Candidatus Doudnabacteria bacterium RIFCSPHIGHO2_02_FULL_46_11]|uniref:tRNA (guanine-N(1)-)-methyltransferase n=1 Tax=Candidatus Doudnabacteria bacterium RIFCSPHIGHO2_02_FULL_46_11 TaxID=1817832 RepID=A0A1F5P913_9BACT|nr:MAG: tRNA (guanosine(37)-N1)-methyltransferase TrmD [Candidatus Doudnabacteria bacterium RIFCSPHIGHO2_02_FULL_46_11]
MKFDIITILPEAFDSYLNSSLLARAQGKELLDVNVWNLRDWATDPHKTVDDRPYGGGAGMVLKVDIAARVLKKLVPRKNKKTRIINFNPQGKLLTQRKVEGLAKKYDRLVLLCGRYEGFDARVEKLVDEEISIGDYVLTGGELPALVLLDAVSRQVPGVVGKEESILHESFSLAPKTRFATLVQGQAKELRLLEHPHYTRPEVFEWKGKKYRVPKVLLSGNHAAIQKWRDEQSLSKTKKNRPDLLVKQ